MTVILLLAAGLTLPELESRLLASNPAYRQAELRVRAAEGMRVQAGLYPNPTIGATGEHVTPTTDGGSVGGFVEQRIVTGGKLGISRALADQELARANAARHAWELRLKGQLASLFFENLAAAARAKTREELAVVASDSARTARELRNIGLLDEPDIRAADVEAQRASLRATQARQVEQRARASLAALLNEDQLDGAFEGGLEEIPHLDRAALWARITSESPEFTLARADMASAELELRQAKAARVPDLQLRGGLRNNREMSDRPGMPVGIEGIFDVGIEIPLFNRQQGAIKAAKARIEAANLARPRTLRGLQTRFAEAWQRYASAKTAVSQYRNEMIPSARQSFEMYQRNFRGMQAQYTLVIGTQRTYFELQDEYFDALRDAWTAAADLQSLLLAGNEAGGDMGPL